MTYETLANEIRELNPEERAKIYALIQALKRSRVTPLAFVEAMINFDGEEDVDAEQQVFEHKMEVTEVLKNRYGMLHGGITATFIDTAMGATTYQMTGGANGAVTLNLAVNFLKPATVGWLTAKTEVIKKGGTIIVMETRVYDEQNEVIATANGTFYQLKHRPDHK